MPRVLSRRAGRCSLAPSAALRAFSIAIWGRSVGRAVGVDESRITISPPFRRQPGAEQAGAEEPRPRASLPARPHTRSRPCGPSTHIRAGPAFSRHCGPLLWRAVDTDSARVRTAGLVSRLRATRRAGGMRSHLRNPRDSDLGLVGLANLRRLSRRPSGRNREDRRREELPPADCSLRLRRRSVRTGGGHEKGDRDAAQH